MEKIVSLVIDVLMHSCHSDTCLIPVMASSWLSRKLFLESGKLFQRLGKILGIVNLRSIVKRAEVSNTHINAC